MLCSLEYVGLIRVLVLDSFLNLTLRDLGLGLSSKKGKSQAPLGVLARAAAIALTALLAEVTVPEILLGGKMKLYLQTRKLKIVSISRPHSLTSRYLGARWCSCT